MTANEVRAWFPALQSGFAYLENAGGSQVPVCVAEAIARHMVTEYVQLGAGYPQADAATSMVNEAHRFMAEFVNAGDAGHIVIGPSTTALINLIAGAYGDIWTEGDEIVIAQANHEANAGAWERLQRRGAKIKIWLIDRETFLCELNSLEELLTERTRLVALPHVSNLVGMVQDVKAVCQMAHQVGAKVCADGVAYAPHRAIDVRELGVDWYVFSSYKVFGPHLAVLYGKRKSFEELTGPNHGFIPKDALPSKWELGGVSHEACAGLLALKPYLEFLASEPYGGHSTVQKAYETIHSLEAPLEAALRDGLRALPGVRLIGPQEASDDSEGTVSFLHDSVPADQIAAAVNRRGIGIRSGHMYAVRLLQGLGIPEEPGVVRVSLVHYNTMEEIERVLEAVESVLSGSAPEV